MTNQIIYVNGKPRQHGLWVWLNENETLSQEINFIHGKRQGTWKYYSTNGRLFSIENYENDQKEGEELWM
jgi:antitoxin component YwqK of YwqJK toxin-antitoxin module